jgi:hypothetical protein
MEDREGCGPTDQFAFWSFRVNTSSPSSVSEGEGGRLDASAFPTANFGESLFHQVG